MPQVYASDYKKYFKSNITMYPAVSKNTGNEYFKQTQYSTNHDRMDEEEKSFTDTPAQKEGDGIVDSVLNIGKTAVNFASKNKELISAIGSIAGAGSQIARARESAKQLDAIKRIRDIRARNNDSAIEPKIKDSENDNARIQNANSNSDTNLQKAKNIIHNFSSNNPTGRGIKKRGGLLKDF